MLQTSMINHGFSQLSLKLFLSLDFAILNNQSQPLSSVIPKHTF